MLHAPSPFLGANAFINSAPHPFDVQDMIAPMDRPRSMPATASEGTTVILHQQLLSDVMQLRSLQACCFTDAGL